MEAESTMSSGIPWKKGIFLSVVILAIFLVVTVIALLLDLDRRVAGLLFTPETGWHFGNAWLWRMLYDYGTLPGLLLTLTALTILFCSLFNSKCRIWRKPMTVVVITAIIGAGLLVNAILKPYCGRPRPREIVEFQGQWDYCMPCFDSTPGKGMSFPCGHCTMGFLFVSLFYCRRQSKWLAISGTLFGLVLGGLLGVTRATQGAHFLTDIVWSLGVIMLVAVLSDYVLFPLLSQLRFDKSAFSRRKAIISGLVFGVVILLITLVFLTRRPYFETRRFHLDLPPEVNELIVLANAAFVKTDIIYVGKKSQILLTGQGFAVPNAGEDIDIGTTTKGRTMVLELNLRKSGYFSELQHQIAVSLPVTAEGRVAVVFQQRKDQ